jgi:hypothetical protein
MGFCEITDFNPVQGVSRKRISPADKGPGHKAPSNFVQPEYGKGIMVLANDKGVNFSST